MSLMEHFYLPEEKRMPARWWLLIKYNPVVIIEPAAQTQDRGLPGSGLNLCAPLRPQLRPQCRQNEQSEHHTDNSSNM